MSISEKIDEAVKESKLAIQDIADKSFIDYKCLYNIRNGQYPSPDKTSRIAKVLQKPDLLKKQCECCPVGSKINLINLDGSIRDEGHDILMKNRIEIKEFLNVQDKLFEILFEEKEYSKENIDFISKGLQEALDVKHCIETLEVWYAKKFGIEEWEKQIKIHNQKCIDKGYALK